jgi:photosystem II stability/assembly factor-like uncharacterized protein
MKRARIYISLIISFFVLTTIIQAQWYEITNIPPPWSSEKIDAFDSLIFVGAIGFTGELYKTEDGGNSWIASTPVPSFIDVMEISGSDKIWFKNYEEIWASKDGGVNWQLQFYDPTLTTFLNYIEMFDSLNGVAMGDAPTLSDPTLFLRTTDGGNNWISMNHNLIGLWSANIWKRVDFVDINVGYFYSFGEIPEKLYKTTNGGTDWIVLSDSMDCKVMRFYDADIGIIAGGECSDSICNPNVYLTTDGGQSWEFTYTDSMGFVMDIEFIPGKPSDVWMIAGNKAFFSSNTGRTWTEEMHIPILTPAYGFRDMAFTDKNHGWIVGREPLSQGFTHHLYRTTNGGFGGLVSVEDNYKEVVPKGYLLYQNFPNPFNPVTKIKYQIPETSFITLKIYDVLGNEIATLVNDEKPAGNYSVKFNAAELPSGIYFYQLQINNFAQTKKMILIK